MLNEEEDTTPGNEWLPIWQIPEAAARFDCMERIDAKALAQALVSKLSPTLGLVQLLPKEFKRVG